jgi:glycerol-3-phosphate dehydrogenase
MFDFVVIGGGVVGTLAARELTKYNLKVALLERQSSVGWGVTKANSGVIHGGYDDDPGTMRAIFARKGNLMYSKLSEELGFSLKRIGSYVVALNDEELETLKELKYKGEKNGIDSLEIKKIQDEPNISRNAKYGLYCKDAGIVEPWEIAYYATMNAIKNGLELFTNFFVNKIEVNEDYTRIYSKDRYVDSKFVINAAGLGAAEISKMFGIEIDFVPRKGEYYLIDKGVIEVNHILFPTPNKYTKGILVLPTVSGTIMVGPNSQEIDDYDDTSTSKDGLSEVWQKASLLVPNLPRRKIIRTFAGVRPDNRKKDFIIGTYKKKRFINLAGMRSPGLTSAPAIAQYLVEKMIEEDLQIHLSKKKEFDPYFRPIKKLNDMSDDEIKEEVKKNPKYGNIVCRCNKISLAEIEWAIDAGAKTLDDVKFMTTAGFGRCQGGFCTSRIMEALSKKLKVDKSEIVKNNPKSNLLVSRTKEGVKYEEF